MEEKIRLGISSCLLGNKVRYDGQDKLDKYLRDTLGKFVEWVPVCPEVECGLTVPREAMRLVGKIESPRLLTQKTKIDYTDKMLSWADAKLKELEKLELCGFVFKSKSPSSGMKNIKVYAENGGPAVKKGVGIFAAEFMKRFPSVPVEEDGRLNDPPLRENFIDKVYTYKRWRKMLSESKKPAALINFHSDHKLLIMSHSPAHLYKMGPMLGSEKITSETFDKYFAMLMESLSLKSTVSKNVNVLQHAAGYFKKLISSDDKKELQKIIDNYHKHLLPLSATLILFDHYINKYDMTYLKRQCFFNPYPEELGLRNYL